jgi:hypothetical protein
MQVIIVAKATTELDGDHPDSAIPGMYVADLDPDTPTELHASAALDAFHESFGIEELDDFSFSVHDQETGEVLPEPDGVDSYVNGHYCSNVEFVSEEVDSKYLGTPRTRPGI